MKPPKLRNPVERMCYVAAFAVLVMRITDTGLAGKVCKFLYIFIYFACVVHLNVTSNPLLAETFEIPELKFMLKRSATVP